MVPQNPFFFKFMVFCLILSLLMTTSCAKDSDLFLEVIEEQTDSGEVEDGDEVSEDPTEPTDEESEPSNSGPLKAFPTAFGGGSNATGGRGKILYIVDTLDDSVAATLHPESSGNDAYYTGGLQDALTLHDVGYIVFNVSGNIDIGVGGTRNWPKGNGQGIYVRGKTVFGQSAPRGGITLTGGTFRIGGFNPDQGNIIIRYLRSRPILNRDGVLSTKDDRKTWAFHFTAVNDLMLDHVSGSFAPDKIAGSAVRQEHVTAPNCPCTNKGQTFQYGLFADGNTGLYTEVNPDRPNNPEKLIDNISYLNNVLISTSRAPNMAFDGFGEVVNNVLHDGQFKSSRVYHDIRLNHLGNYYQRTNGVYSWIGGLESNDVPQVFTRRNVYNGSIKINGYNSGIINLKGNDSEDNTILWIDNPDRDRIADPVHLAATQFPSTVPNPWTETTAQDAFNRLVLKGNVGAYKYLDDDGEVQEYRDSFDMKMLSILRDNRDYNPKVASNWVLPSIPSNTRPADYDTDNDGMSDTWEIQQFGNLDQSYRGDFDGDGYENIEEYMNQVDFQ
ncbi:pectate lyase [Croceitalea sp. MTPC5]|nr:pectate lyase [Croceitalea sp. MTPC5]